MCVVLISVSIIFSVPFLVSVNIQNRPVTFKKDRSCFNASSATLVLHQLIKFWATWFRLRECRLEAVCHTLIHNCAKHTPKNRQTNKYIKSSVFFAFSGDESSGFPLWWVHGSVSLLSVCLNILFLCRMQPESERASPSSSSLEASVSIETQRKRQHAFDLLDREKKNQPLPTSKTIYPFL